MHDIENEPEKYKVDLKETIKANGLKFVFHVVITLVLVMYIQMFNRIIEQFQLPEMKVIALFVFGYTVMKSIFAVVPDFEVMYKLRDEDVRQEH